MIIQYSINDGSIVETAEMLRAEKRGHEIGWDLICFVQVTIKNDVHSKRSVGFNRVPFFRLMEDLKYFWDDSKDDDYAKANLSCIDQFYSFKIEKEGSFLLFSHFDDWKKWEPIKIRHEGIEKEIRRVCRQFLKDYTARLPMLRDYSQIDLIERCFSL